MSSSRIRYGAMPQGAPSTNYVAAAHHALQHMLDVAHDKSIVMGPTGPKGEPGDLGFVGPTGPAGPAGRDGMDGVDGLVGSTGCAGPTGATGPRGEFNHHLGSMSRLVISSPQGLKLDNLGKGSGEFASHKLSAARVWQMPDASGQLVLQNTNIHSTDLDVRGELQLVEATGPSSSLAGLRSWRAREPGQGGVMFMGESGHLRFRGGTDADQWMVLGQNGYAQFSVQNTPSSTGSAHYTTKGTIGTLEAKKTLLAGESVYVGQHPMGITIKLGLAHPTAPQLLFAPSNWTASCRIGLLLGDDQGFIERTHDSNTSTPGTRGIGLTLQDPASIYLNALRGKVFTPRNTLDGGNGDALFAGNVQVMSAITVASQVRPSRFQGSVVASGSPNADCMSAFGDLGSANVQLGSTPTTAFIQAISNRMTHDVPLHLNAQGGAVMSAHNVVDDNAGNASVSGKFSVGGLDVRAARHAYFKISGMLGARCSFAPPLTTKGDGWALSDNNDCIIIAQFDNPTQPRWFEITCQLYGVIPAGTTFSGQIKDTIITDHNVSPTLQKRSLSMFCVVSLQAGEQVAVDVKGFAMISGGFVKVMEIV